MMSETVLLSDSLRNMSIMSPPTHDTVDRDTYQQERQMVGFIVVFALLLVFLAIITCARKMIEVIYSLKNYKFNLNFRHILKDS